MLSLCCSLCRLRYLLLIVFATLLRQFSYSFEASTSLSGEVVEELMQPPWGSLDNYCYSNFPVFTSPSLTMQMGNRASRMGAADPPSSSSGPANAGRPACITTSKLTLKVPVTHLSSPCMSLYIIKTVNLLSRGGEREADPVLRPRHPDGLQSSVVPPELPARHAGGPDDGRGEPGLHGLRPRPPAGAEPRVRARAR